MEKQLQRRYVSVQVLSAKLFFPFPDGPLLISVSSTSILAANREVKQLLGTAEKEKELQCKRGTYECFTPEAKARIAKRSAEFGVTTSIRYISLQSHAYFRSDVGCTVVHFDLGPERKRRRSRPVLKRPIGNSEFRPSFDEFQLQTALAQGDLPGVHSPPKKKESRRSELKRRASWDGRIFDRNGALLMEKMTREGSKLPCDQ